MLFLRNMEGPKPLQLFISKMGSKIRRKKKITQEKKETKNRRLTSQATTDSGSIDQTKRLHWLLPAEM